MNAAETKREPLFRQVANVLRARIVDGDQSEPVRLPTEAELARTYGVSRFTIRHALAVLAEEGLIGRARSRGTFTNPVGIRAWRRLHHRRVIKAIVGRYDLAKMPATYFGQIYQGILSKAEQAGYSVAALRTSGEFPALDATYKPEDPAEVLGVILVGLRDDRYIAMHAEAGYPVVCVDHWPLHPLADAVVVDCFAEGLRAVEYLVRQGHRELFYLGHTVQAPGGPEPERDARLVEAGYRRAAAAAGLNVSAERVAYYRSNRIEVAAALDWFTSLAPRPTAGFIFSEEVLGLFVEGLEARGLRCPEDVSLLCKMQAIDPSDATAFRVEAFLLGGLAVELLLERAAGKRTSGFRVAVASTLRRGWSVRGCRWEIPGEC